MSRIRGGLTQVSLAKKVHRAQTTVSQSEAGRITVSQAYITAVLKVCGVPQDWGPKYYE